MRDRSRISALAITPATTMQKRTGLHAFATFVVDGALRVDGVTVRLSANGELVLSYPARRDRSGATHPYVLPIDDAVRREVERQILAALGYDGGAA